MFGKNFQRRYALTDQGVKNTKKGAFWTVIVNLVVMGGMGILYLLMYGLMGTLTDGAPLPGPALFLGLVIAFVILSFVTHLQQYHATYGLVYNEVKSTRLSLAERLRKLPLGYFGKRDLADLTETLMGDVNRMEHVWSHVLGYLYGAYISTAIIAVCLLVYDWRLTIACLWGVPVAFGLLFGTRKISARASERTKQAAIRVSDGIQEALENVREIRATNQEVRYLAGLNQKIDDHEKVTIQGELGTGIFVNAASVIMRLGVATTILAGASLIVSGQIDFMLLFLFLLVITRVYAPFDQSLALIAELFVSQVSADRMNEIYDTPTAEGAEVFEPKGHDIVFDHVDFAYDKKKVLDGVSFTAREGEVTALVGPSGSGKSTLCRTINRLETIDSGEILIDGTKMPEEGRRLAELRSQIGMVFQSFNLVTRTSVVKNVLTSRVPDMPLWKSIIGLYSKEDKVIALEALDKVGILDKAYVRADQLSGGQQQRVALARTLAQNPEIILADEPVAALDPITAAQVMDDFKKINQELNMSVLINIHHVDLALKYADRVIGIKAGEIVYDGPSSEVTNDVLTQIYGRELAQDEIMGA